MAVRKSLDQDFFKKWTPDMAYVLGFFAADGNMIRTKRGSHFISFHITDRIVLQYIRDALGSNHKIAARHDPRPNHKAGYRLQIGSKELFHDLGVLGFTPHKSKTLAMPAVPAQCVGHFVRGYFDGDGCVYFKKLKVKDRKKKKWIFSSRFTAGSRTFLDPLLITLRSRGLMGGFIVQKQRGFELVFSHHDSVALFRLMYDTVPDNGLFLPRKRRLFERAIRTLYGNKRP